MRGKFVGDLMRHYTSLVTLFSDILILISIAGYKMKRHLSKCHIRISYGTRVSQLFDLFMDLNAFKHADLISMQATENLFHLRILAITLNCVLI